MVKSASYCVAQPALGVFSESTPGRCVCALKRDVCGTGLHSLIILKAWTHIYLAKACISITLTVCKYFSENKQTSSPCLSPARAASFRCISVAGWNICFCCSKNCLFVLTITPWCFSFYFLNLLKVVIQFQVLQGSEFLETQYGDLLRAGVYIELQSAHLWHFGRVVPEEARSSSVMRRNKFA